MKDFKAYFDANMPAPQGPTMGGSAFSLPDIVSPITHLVPALGLASFGLLLRPWRLLRILPFRRGGMVGGFFAWGRLATILLALMLLVAPGTLQHSFPQWHTLALGCFIISGLSVLGAISRCCGSAISCAFWVALTLFMGDRAFRPERSAQSQQIARSFQPDQPVIIEQQEWEDMFTGEPVAAHLVSYAHRQARPAERMTAPREVVSQGIFSGIQDSIAGQLSAVIPDGSILGASVLPNVGDWADGEALPESAYFGGAAKVGPVGQAFAEASPDGGGLDQIMEKVGSFLKK